TKPSLMNGASERMKDSVPSLMCSHLPYSCAGSSLAVLLGLSSSTTNTCAWCTILRLPGRSSAETTHRSSVRFAGTVILAYSSGPLAESVNFGMGTIMSGVPARQSSAKTGGAGRSFGSPSGLPPSAQAFRVSISAAVKLGSLDHLPKCGSAFQGGILRESTASLIDAAHGLTSWYVISAMGAMSFAW